MSSVPALELTTRRPSRIPATAWGLAGTLALLGVYLAILGGTESWRHATDSLRRDWYLVLPVALAFGVQVVLFVNIRRRARGGRAMTAATGAASGAAMVACCAHHVADVLPVFGLAGASAFLARWRWAFLLVALASNAFGITYLARRLRRIA